MDKKRKEQMFAVVGIIAAAGLILWFFRHVQPDGTFGPDQTAQQLPTVEAEGFQPQTYTPGAINVPGVTNGGFAVPGTTATSPSNVPALTTVNFLPSSPFQYVPSSPVPVVTLGSPSSNSTGPSISNSYPGVNGVSSPDGATNGCGCNGGGGFNTVSFGSPAAQAAYLGAAGSNIQAQMAGPTPLQSVANGVNAALAGIANFVINLAIPATPSTTVQPIVVNNVAATQPQYTPGAGYNDPVDAPFRNLLIYPN